MSEVMDTGYIKSATRTMVLASTIITNKVGIRDSIVKVYSDLAGVVYHGNNAQLIDANKSSFEAISADAVIDTIAILGEQLDVSKSDFGSDIQTLLTDKEHGLIATLKKHGISRSNDAGYDAAVNALRQYSSVIVTQVPDGADQVTEEAKKF